jgi:hypothetical protein
MCEAPHLSHTCVMPHVITHVAAADLSSPCLLPTRAAGRTRFDGKTDALVQRPGRRACLADTDRRQVAARAREPLDLPRVQLHDPPGVRLSGAQSPLQMHPPARRLRPVGQHGACTLTCTLVPHRRLHAHSFPTVVSLSPVRLPLRVGCSSAVAVAVRAALVCSCFACAEAQVRRTGQRRGAM